MVNDMKKKIIALLMTTILTAGLITGCGANQTDDNRNADEVKTEETQETEGMVHLETAEEVTAFFDELYQKVPQDMLPASIATTEVPLDDMETVTYHTGLEDLRGIEGIYISESMIGSVAYSALYIRTNDEADAVQLRQTLMDKINPSKWICVTAEKQIAALFGNDIFFVMAASDTADEVYGQAKKVAESRQMPITEAIDKTNAQ